jgi:hypothetical protein
MELNILIDYDNIPVREVRLGLKTLFDRVLSLLPISILQDSTRIRARLYGGWFEDDRMSRKALDLDNQIKSEFPSINVVKNEDKRILQIVNMELAISLEAKRDKVLSHTYRPNYKAKRIYCKDPKSSGCSSPNCAMEPVFKYFQSFECPDSSCKLDYAKVFVSNTQKLVDSMLICDMIYHSVYGNKLFVIVSADDDMIPGIGMSLIGGAKVFHIHPYPKRVTPPQYDFGFSKTYFQTSF